jgi:hypothetical protein
MNSEEVLQNLQIMDLAKQWPVFQALHDMAKVELEVATEKAAAELKQWAETKARKIADEEARRAVIARHAVEREAAVKPRAIPSHAMPELNLGDRAVTRRPEDE